MRNARRANGLFIFVDRILVRLDLVFFCFFSSAKRQGFGAVVRGHTSRKQSSILSGLKRVSVEKEQFV